MISCALIVAVVALAWKRAAAAPTERVRLNAIAASTSHALFAENDPDGGCAKGPERRSTWTCSITACPRWACSASSIGSGESREYGVVTVGGEQHALPGRDTGRVPVFDPAHDQPGMDVLALLAGGESHERAFGDLKRRRPAGPLSGL